MPGKKARPKAPRKRPLSKGIRHNRPSSNHGGGKKFPPGQNSHDGTVFRRGPDQLPRGSGLLMLRTVFLDKRQEIYDNLCDLVTTPRGAHAFVTDFTDRVDGKPKQGLDVNVRRTTIFSEAEPAAPPPPEAARESDDGTTPGPNGERMVPL